MRAIFAYFFLLWAFTFGLEAAIRSDVSVIEASEGVQYSVQEIAKDYLLGHLYPQNRSLQKRIQNNLEVLDESIQQIATNTKDKKTKGILSYFITQKSQIIELLKQKDDNESIETMVEISEIFSEGSKSIAKQHTYSFTKEEKMLMLTKEMMTLIGSIIKYSIAIDIDPHNKENKKSIKRAMERFVQDLEHLNQYTYGVEMIKKKESLNRSWRTVYIYLNKKDPLKIPALLSISSKNIQKVLEVLSVYHSKNK